ncbi:hypothetical protein KP509_07G085400 [Ceratopteris richardii]|uniref:Uncharacterized protein n=1 Tax=Ceratopteris richardii TaxID=49495 RepID=A0A8T2UGJ0_CERRI|nr:hypothetical protein KP509_07G085400 [Ceratopteris richardii]
MISKDRDAIVEALTQTRQDSCFCNRSNHLGATSIISFRAKVECDWHAPLLASISGCSRIGWRSYQRRVFLLTSTPSRPAICRPLSRAWYCTLTSPAASSTPRLCTFDKATHSSDSSR